MKTQTLNATAAVQNDTSTGAHQGKPGHAGIVRVAFLLVAMLGLTACEVYPSGPGYAGGGYGPGYSSGINRYSNYYSSYPRYGGYGGGARHSSSYGVQHSYGQSFIRPSYGHGTTSHGGGNHSGSRGSSSHGGSRGSSSHGGGRGRH